MKIGWMWFDDSDKDLKEKVALAAARYKRKFRKKPNRCFVNASAVDSDLQVGVIKVIGRANILPDHFWLGVDTEAIKA